MINKPVKFCLLTFLLLCSSFVCGGVYQCTSDNGLVEFQAFPCSATKAQVFLPLAYQETDIKTVRNEEKALAVLEKKQAKKQRQNAKHAKQIEKRIANQEAQALRRKARCLRWDEKINKLETQLRQGIKQKRIDRIKTELEYYVSLKQRYCIPQK